MILSRSEKDRFFAQHKKKDSNDKIRAFELSVYFAEALKGCFNPNSNFITDEIYTRIESIRFDFEYEIFSEGLVSLEKYPKKIPHNAIGALMPHIEAFKMIVEDEFGYIIDNDVAFCSRFAYSYKDIVEHKDDIVEDPFNPYDYI